MRQHKVIQGPAFWHRLRLQEACEVIARSLCRDEFGYWVIHNGMAILCSPNCMCFSTAIGVNERHRGGLTARPQGQRGFVDLLRERYQEPPDDLDDNMPPRDPRTPPEDVPHHEEALDEAIPDDARPRTDDVGDDDNDDADEWMSGSTLAPPALDISIGAAAQAPNEAAQAFGPVDVTCFLEEGVDIDPRDLRRRRGFRMTIQSSSSVSNRHMTVGRFPLVANLKSASTSWSSSYRMPACDRSVSIVRNSVVSISICASCADDR